MHRPSLASLGLEGLTGQFLTGILASGLFVLAGHAGHAEEERPPVRALVDDGLAAYAAGRLEEAVEIFQGAATRAEREGLAGEAGRARNNACVALNALTRHAEAVSDCQAAVRIRRRLEQSAEAPDSGVARSVNNLAIALRGVGRLEEARVLLAEALERNRSARDRDGEMANLVNLGVLDERMGRYGSALRNLERAQSLARLESPQRLAEAQLNMAIVLERVGSYEDALERLDSLLGAPSESVTIDVLAAARLNRGVVLRNLGDWAAALEDFERAEQLYERLGDRLGVATVEMNRAQVALHDRVDLGAAWRSLERVENAARMAADPVLEIEASWNRGEVLWRLGDCERARPVFERTLALSEGLQSAAGVWSAEFGLARCDRQDGSFASAIERLERATAEIENVGERIEATVRRHRYLVASRGVYEEFVSVLLADSSSQVERAADLASRAKDRALVTRTETGGPLAPGTRRAGNGRSREVVLDYFQTGERLLVFVHRDAGVSVFDLGPSAAVMERALSVAAAVRANAVASLDLAWLAGQLLPDALWQAVDDEALVISPDLALRELPFVLLPRPVEAARDSGGFLVDGVTILYRPSAYRVEPSSVEVESAVRLLAIVPGDEARAPTGEIVPALPGAEAEVAAAERWLGGRALISRGSAANPSAIALAPPVDVLHIAAHARSAAGLLGEPEIWLAADAAHPEGRLGGAEIADLDLATELTVLAACSSALGRSSGVLETLGGAFLAAGSRSIVASLWDVDDIATQALVERFYWHLGRGEAAATALQKAQRALRADPRFEDPVDWAGWVLIGENVRLTPERSVRWTVPMIVVLSLAALLALLVVTRR